MNQKLSTYITESKNRSVALEKEKRLQAAYDRFISIYNNTSSGVDSVIKNNGKQRCISMNVPEFLQYEWQVLYFMYKKVNENWCEDTFKDIDPWNDRIFGSSIIDGHLRYNFFIKLRDKIKAEMLNDIKEKVENDDSLYVEFKEYLDKIYNKNTLGLKLGYDSGKEAKNISIVLSNLFTKLKIRSKTAGLWDFNQFVKESSSILDSSTYVYKILKDIDKFKIFEVKGIKNLKTPKTLTERLLDLCMPEFQKDNNGEIIYSKPINKHIDLSDIKKLVESGANVNAHDFYNNYGSLINMLVGYYNENDCLDIVKYLYSKGADINSQNSLKVSCVYLAAYMGKYDILKWLLDEGADPDIPNNGDVLPVHVAFKNKNYRCGFLILEYTSKINTRKFKLGECISKYYKIQKRIIEKIPEIITDIKELHPKIKEEYDYLLRGHKSGLWDMKNEGLVDKLKADYKLKFFNEITEKSVKEFSNEQLVNMVYKHNWTSFNSSSEVIKGILYVYYEILKRKLPEIKKIYMPSDINLVAMGFGKYQIDAIKLTIEKDEFDLIDYFFDLYDNDISIISGVVNFMTYLKKESDSTFQEASVTRSSTLLNNIFKLNINLIKKASKRCLPDNFVKYLLNRNSEYFNGLINIRITDVDIIPSAGIKYFMSDNMKKEYDYLFRSEKTGLWDFKESSLDRFENILPSGIIEKFEYALNDFIKRYYEKEWDYITDNKRFFGTIFFLGASYKLARTSKEIYLYPLKSTNLQKISNFSTLFNKLKTANTRLNGQILQALCKHIEQIFIDGIKKDPHLYFKDFFDSLEKGIDITISNTVIGLKYDYDETDYEIAKFKITLPDWIKRAKNSGLLDTTIKENTRPVEEKFSEYVKKGLSYITLGDIYHTDKEIINKILEWNDAEIISYLYPKFKNPLTVSTFWDEKIASEYNKIGEKYVKEAVKRKLFNYKNGCWYIKDKKVNDKIIKTINWTLADIIIDPFVGDVDLVWYYINKGFVIDVGFINTYLVKNAKYIPDNAVDFLMNIDPTYISFVDYFSKEMKEKYKEQIRQKKVDLWNFNMNDK